MGAIFRSKQSKMQGLVSDAEPLGRFVLQSGWLNKTDPKNVSVRPNAFLPQPLSSVAVSVYRVHTWSEDEIQAKGSQVANEREENHRSKMMAKGESYSATKTTFRHLGRAHIITSDVRGAGLDVLPKEPPPRHADIVGWPSPAGLNKKEDEAAQLEYAQKLASKCSFVPAK
jgi:hypothetical protein